jgi:hypothetical protein
VGGGTVQLARRGRDRIYDARAARDFESQLVWILGSPRSGSTWLLRMLGDLWNVIPVNEPLIGWYLGPFLADLPGFGHPENGDSRFTIRRVQDGKSDQFFAREFADVWRPALRDMMNARFLAHARRYASSAPLWRTLLAIQEPNGSQSADIIMGALPKSRFLFLLRDGRDVVDSELAANQKGAWISAAFPGAQGIERDERADFIVHCAEKWLWRTTVVQEAFDAHAGPRHMLRYEELREDPLTQMRGVLDWLGIEIADGKLEAIVERHSFEQLPPVERGPEKFFRAAQPGLWRENLSVDEQQAVEQIIGPKLRELGYPP